MTVREVIFFLENQEVSATFWLSDFEQMIRQRLPLKASVTGRIRAVYAQLNEQNKASALVLFELPVKGGLADAGWHMPLRRLADQADNGPDLGGGRIRLACRSQCPISWHADALWEPQTSDFFAIRKALQEKRPQADVSADARPAAAFALTPPAGRITGDIGWALARKHDDQDAEELKRVLRQEMDAYRRQLQHLQHEMAHYKTLNSRLEHQLQESTQAELEAACARAESDLESMREQNTRLHQRQNELSQDNQALKAQLEVLQQTLAQRPLAEELEQLKQANDDLQQRLADAEAHRDEHLIQVLEEQDAMLVAFHPGAGHLTIKAAQIPAYAAGPLAYAAGKCGVSETVYRQWLAHYDDPRCQRCATRITQVAHPKDFSQDLHAFCKLHRNIRFPGESDQPD